MHIHFKSYPLFSVGNEFGKSYSIFFHCYSPNTMGRNADVHLWGWVGMTHPHCPKLMGVLPCFTWVLKVTWLRLGLLPCPAAHRERLPHSACKHAGF